MTDSNSGWYLRHRDGVEHGPFRYADIVAAAKRGNIAEDTCVFHDEKTLGQWVFAQRVESIAEVLPQTQPASSRKAANRSTRGTPRSSAQAPAKTAANDNKRPADEAKTETAESKKSLVDSMPVIRPRREQGYPVPKTFVGACVAFLDVRFQSFVTPWVIKLLWSLCLAVAILVTVKLAYDALLTGNTDVNATAAEINDPGNWQFQPLAEQPWLKTNAMRFLSATGAIFIAMLCL